MANNRFQMEFNDDLDELLSDPGILNNHEKLMQMKVTEKDLADAASTTLVEKSQMLSEIILQDTSLPEIFRKLQESQELQRPDPKTVVSALIENINGYQEKCIKVVSEMKNSPFWDPASSNKVFGQNGQEMVGKWMETLDTFGQKYEKARTLRMSRQSILPRIKNDTNDVVITLSKLKGIMSELKSLADVFDSDNEEDSSDQPATSQKVSKTE